MTVLIALELNHSNLSVSEWKYSIVHLRTVVLIALLVREFIIIDAKQIEPATLLGLAAAILALGAPYFIVRHEGHTHELKGVQKAKVPISNRRTNMERVKGIEPSYSAWKAAALPLSYTRS